MNTKKHYTIRFLSCLNFCLAMLYEVLTGAGAHVINTLRTEYSQSFVEAIEAENYAYIYWIVVLFYITARILPLGLMLLMFSVFYYIGKTHNIALNLQFTTLAIIISTYFGSLIGRIAVFLSRAPSNSFVKELLFSLISPKRTHYAFMVFAALSLAYLRFAYPYSRASPESFDPNMNPENLTLKQLFIIIAVISAIVGALYVVQMSYLPIIFLVPDLSSASTFSVYFRPAYIGISWSIMCLGILGGFRIGRRFKFDTPLRSIIIHILGGSFLGYWIGTSVMGIGGLFVGIVSDPLAYVIGLVLASAAIESFFALPQLFFMVFTALSAAYFRASTNEEIMFESTA